MHWKIQHGQDVNIIQMVLTLHVCTSSPFSQKQLLQILVRGSEKELQYPPLEHSNIESNLLYSNGHDTSKTGSNNIYSICLGAAWWQMHWKICPPEKG